MLLQAASAFAGITKAVDHPRAPEHPGVVRMDSAYSMWRSRTIPDPKQPDRPACETVRALHCCTVLPVLGTALQFRSGPLRSHAAFHQEQLAAISRRSASLTLIIVSLASRGMDVTL